MRLELRYMGFRKRKEKKAELVFSGHSIKWNDSDSMKFQLEEESILYYLQHASYRAQIETYYNERKKREEKEKELYERFIVEPDDWRMMISAVISDDEDLDPDKFIERLRNYFDKIEKNAQSERYNEYVRHASVPNWEREIMSALENGYGDSYGYD